MAVLNLFKEDPVSHIGTVEFDPSVDSASRIENAHGADFSLHYDTRDEATEAVRVHPMKSYSGAGELPMP